MGFPRKLAAGTCLVAVTLGLATTPPASAAPAPGARTVIVLPSTGVPAGPRFIPPHTNGDKDFKGNGPRVTTTASLEFRDGNRRMVVVLCMTAEETKKDHTTASGCSGDHTIFLAPSGECVSSVGGIGRFDEMHYTDTDHGFELFDGSPANYVAIWNIVGDDNGDDAGVRTGFSIATRLMQVTTIPC